MGPYAAFLGSDAGFAKPAPTSLPGERHATPMAEVAESAVLRAAFRHGPTRRALVERFGAATVLAALASVFPLDIAKEALAQGGPGGTGAPEKRDLKIGFIPITCATPIIMAYPMGFYQRHGLNVEVIRAAGWAVIRDRAIARESDAAHMLSPMPLAMSLGVGVAQPIPFAVAAIENGMARPSRWPPSIARSATRATGRASASPCPSISRSITTCCAFAVPRSMITEMPNTFAALMRAIVEATAYSQRAENRREVAAAISGTNYLNQPETVVNQVLTGTSADGLGRVQRVPDRIGFEPLHPGAAAGEPLGVDVAGALRHQGQRDQLDLRDLHLLDLADAAQQASGPAGARRGLGGVMAMIAARRAERPNARRLRAQS